MLLLQRSDRSWLGAHMLAIAGGILLAVLTLCLLPWLLAGAAWTLGILIVVAVAAAALWTFWVGAQSSAGLLVELMLSGALSVWLFLKMPPSPSGQPMERFFRAWGRVVSAAVLAPLEYWQSIQERRLRGEPANVVQ